MYPGMVPSSVMKLILRKKKEKRKQIMLRYMTDFQWVVRKLMESCEYVVPPLHPACVCVCVYETVGVTLTHPRFHFLAAEIEKMYSVQLL